MRLSSYPASAQKNHSEILLNAFHSFNLLIDLSTELNYSINKNDFIGYSDVQTVQFHLSIEFYWAFYYIKIPNMKRKKHREKTKSPQKLIENSGFNSILMN